MPAAPVAFVRGKFLTIILPELGAASVSWSLDSGPDSINKKHLNNYEAILWVPCGLWWGGLCRMDWTRTLLLACRCDLTRRTDRIRPRRNEVFLTFTNCIIYTQWFNWRNAMCASSCAAIWKLGSWISRCWSVGASGPGAWTHSFGITRL